MNAKEKTIWYLIMNIKDLIAINYQDKKGNWHDNQMKNYYYTLKEISFEIACRSRTESDMNKMIADLETDIEAVEKMIQKDMEDYNNGV